MLRKYHQQADVSPRPDVRSQTFNQAPPIHEISTMFF